MFIIGGAAATETDGLTYFIKGRDSALQLYKARIKKTR
jgi:hypothetical protein